MDPYEARFCGTETRVMTDHQFIALRQFAYELLSVTIYACAIWTLVLLSSDLYVVSGDGTVIITWDHHTQTKGLRIDCAVSESSKLLAEMNNMGAEMEVFHSDGSPAA
jgi:hypothetical protein